MALPKVPDTIQLRGKYHVKIRVDPRIRKHWGGKEVLQRSLRTSDAATAEREVRLIRAIMDQQISEVKAAEGAEALARHLPADQRALLEAAGGLQGLLDEFELRKRALVFLRAGEPAEAGPFDIEEESNGSPIKVLSDQFAEPEELAVQQAEHSAALAVIRGQTNARGRVLRQIGEDVELEGDVFSLRDVIEKWAPTVDPQTADAARYYVRRFTELCGEIAVAELTTAHLRDYADAIKGLPAVTSGKLPDGRHVRDLPFREAVAWAKKSRSGTLSEATVKKYVSMLKSLMGFAVGQGYRLGDPWATYSLPAVKRKHSDRQRRLAAVRARRGPPDSGLRHRVQSAAIR